MQLLDTRVALHVQPFASLPGAVLDAVQRPFVSCPHCYCCCFAFRLDVCAYSPRVLGVVFCANIGRGQTKNLSGYFSANNEEGALSLF